MKVSILFCMLFMSVVAAEVQASCSGTASAQSCTAGSTPAQVQTAINTLNSGGTLTLASGAYSWSSGVRMVDGAAPNVPKSITIQGAGSGATVITSSTTTAMFELTPANNTDLLRVTGIGFQLGSMGNGRRAILLHGQSSTTGKFLPTKVRLDHLAITGGGNTSCIHISNRVYGLIDHIVVTNCYSPIYVTGDFDENNYWIDAFNAGGVFAGTVNALFIEDSQFLYTGAIDTGDASIYIQAGALVTVRHNVFDASTVSNIAGVLQLMYNNHGNQSYCTGMPCNNGGPNRGQPIFESYNNTAICATDLDCEIMSLRGGSSLIHHETYSVAGGGAGKGYGVKFSEEECWQGAFFSPLRSAWPAQDQATPNFIFQNTYNGVPLVWPTHIDVTGDGACGATFFHLNRDIFMHAPCLSSDSTDIYGATCTHGAIQFTGTRYGGSTTDPTDGAPLVLDAGNTIFVAGLTNNYYPYTPYTYPHPLQGGDTTPPAAPTGVQISRPSTPTNLYLTGVR